MSEERAGTPGARALAVIPARYGAARFPGKPLAVLWGKPLVQHVWERAARIENVGLLVVATDDERIAAAARAFGATVEMTSPECASGTDRVAEVARRRPEHGIVVNLQGDEPELDPVAVAQMIEGLENDPSLGMATLAHAESDPRLLATEHVVKVRVDDRGEALYFSRKVPSHESGDGHVLRHIGVYGFRRETLLEFSAWPPGVAERAERLEQLRALEHGVRIQVFLARGAWSGVDTPEQLEALERRGAPDRAGA